MKRVLVWDTHALPRACGQFVRDQAGVWHKVSHRLAAEEACRLLNEVQARLPLLILGDGCACSEGLHEPSRPGGHSGGLAQESAGGGTGPERW